MTIEKDLSDYDEMYRSFPILICFSKGDYLNKVFKKTELSYTAIYRRVRYLQDQELIYPEYVGRKVFYRLTSKGKIISDLILQIHSHLKG